MKRITGDLESLVGKTIKEIRNPNSYRVYGAIAVFFEDGFYTILKPESYGDGDYEIEIYDDELNLEWQYEFGFITQSEYETAQAEEREAQAREKEESERRFYKRLKEKYGDTE